MRTIKTTEKYDKQGKLVERITETTDSYELAPAYPTMPFYPTITTTPNLPTAPTTVTWTNPYIAIC